MWRWIFQLSNSMKKNKVWLFIFRQDLRTYDNTWLRRACLECDEVIPLFVFDTDVLDAFPSDDKRIGFQRDALQHIEQEIEALWWQLYVMHGKATECVTEVIETQTPDAVYTNRSYGTGSVYRDKTIRTLCETKDIEYISCTDYLLLEIDVVETRKVFTPFFKKRLPRVQEIQHTRDDPRPLPFTTPDITLTTLADHYDTIAYHSHPYWKIVWIRDHLRDLSLTEYDITRNLPANTSWTTKLSPYLAFGILSPREVFGQFVNSMSVSTWFPTEKNRADIIVSELAWREFRQHTSYRFPATTYQWWQAFQEKRQGINRENNEERFERWKTWTTGYPLVDAGMRQLLEENRMHNRVRMVVASFLTKDLLIDRRWWEKHFADYLVDYDRNVNIGNRQRSASVWADPKPLRIFNPILQSKRYDPLAQYILRRVPEVKWQPIPAIHDPIKFVLDYHPPVVDHYVWSKEARLRYNTAKAIYTSSLGDVQ